MYLAADSEARGSSLEASVDHCLPRLPLQAYLLPAPLIICAESRLGRSASSDFKEYIEGPPQPYSFGYDTTDEFGTQLFHKEQGDANNAKTGSYGYRDANGIFRTVKYVADANGFRATIDTNEPGTAPGASADAVFNANPVAAPAVAPGAGKGGRYAGAKPAAYTSGAGAGGPWAG
ncbi:hypothetical protein HPB50_001322 [Hyalomma asiaticum]|uniref:Uncharacterized protein n=1 Tax=Hyalomma asiaticum TaxID=266040 RepID=A0ACB7SWK6_HYAAI|nr:hypothetical protein HPB50_001322 [Hyalomma asiaticum]